MQPWMDYSQTWTWLHIMQPLQECGQEEEEEAEAREARI